MATFRYAVIWVSYEWRIVSNRRSIGHFHSIDTALGIAESLAREAVEEGHEAELLLQEPFGKLSTVTIGEGKEAPQDAAAPPP